MSNGNSLNIIFQYEHVFISNGNVKSWKRKKSFVDVKRYHFWYLVLENIRKYFLIILKLCRLNKKFNLYQAYTIKVLKLKQQRIWNLLTAQFLMIWVSFTSMYMMYPQNTAHLHPSKILAYVELNRKYHCVHQLNLQMFSKEIWNALEKIM